MNPYTFTDIDVLSWNLFENKSGTSLNKKINVEYRSFHEKLEMQVSSLIAKKKNYLLRVNSWSAKIANIQLIAEEKQKQENLISCKEGTAIVQISEKNDVIYP